MAVKIRLSRIGKKKAPCYRIVAVDSRKKRDGAYLDNLGTYNALKGVIVTINQERIDYWLDNGAVTTDSVKKIIKRHEKGAVPGDKKAPVKKADTAKKEAKEATPKAAASSSVKASEDKKNEKAEPKATPKAK